MRWASRRSSGSPTRRTSPSSPSSWPVSTQRRSPDRRSRSTAGRRRRSDRCAEVLICRTSAQRSGVRSADGDQVLPAGLRGDGDGDGADERGGGGEDGDPEQPVAGGAGDEGCRDQRGEAPTEGRGQLVAQGG